MFAVLKLVPYQHSALLHFLDDKLTSAIELKVPSKLLSFHFLLTLNYTIISCYVLKIFKEKKR